MLIGILYKLLCLFPAVTHCRIFGNVPTGGVNINQIRGKFRKFRVVKHGILPVLTVFGLVKGRLNAVMQQKQFQYLYDIMGGASA